MLNGHTDTVGIEGLQDPFSAKIRDGRMYGRGAYDMKGGLAACMAAAKALVDEGIVLQGDLLVAAVADEEYASIGTSDLLTHCDVNGAIVAEPTGMELCLAHRGFIWLEVETIGRAAHGSRFDEGIDANMRMGRFLAELDKLEQKLRCSDGHPLLGPPSLHASKIQGGTELSMYAARCKLQIERRTIPKETERMVMGELQAIIDKLANLDPKFKATLRSLRVGEPFEASHTTTIVRSVEQAMISTLGRQPARIGHAAWLDSALLSAAGVDTVVVGPIGAGAHSHEEWVELESLVDLAQVLAQSAINYCR
jgi:acetylornithine deacetylase